MNLSSDQTGLDISGEPGLRDSGEVNLGNPEGTSKDARNEIPVLKS